VSAVGFSNYLICYAFQFSGQLFVSEYWPCCPNRVAVLCCYYCAKLQLMTNRKSRMGFPLNDTMIDDLELLCGQILLEFRNISRVSDTITAKRMKVDSYCRRRNCGSL